MRVTYRNHNVKDYWTSRWDDIPADQPMDNIQVYPLKYAEQIVIDKHGKILEAGCGAGRILRYYHNQKFDIVGMDFIEVAIEKLKKIDSTLKVEVGDITDLRFNNEAFKYILAFGLYHNLENDLGQAIKETFRVLENGGSVCASFRADNFQTRFSDWLANRRLDSKFKKRKSYVFHKMNLTRKEFAKSFEKEGFIVKSLNPVENMPIFYKFSIFRAKKHKIFDENIARSEGYKLSFIGQVLQNLVMFTLPNQFCNIYVLIAYKK
ncbi:class I SAM-dependent methyltransferase [bacterium]|nr:class I SAM-dependent methyltransferase [bacterium]